MSFVTLFIEVIKHGAIFGQDNLQKQLFPDPWSYLWPFLQKYIGSLLGLRFREQLIPRTAAKRGDLLSPFPSSCCPLLALQSHLPHTASSHPSRTFPGADPMWPPGRQATLLIWWLPTSTEDRWWECGARRRERRWWRRSRISHSGRTEL